MNRFEALSRGRRAFLATTVSLVICLVLVTLAELGVRVRHYLKYGSLWRVENTYQHDEQIGLRVPVANRTGEIRTNSHGFRSPEIEVAKAPGSIRIAFLGGSTTFSSEVRSNELTWPHLAAAEIGSRFPDLTVEYINAGVPGYVVRQSARNLLHRVAPFDPDVIVIYHATNDLAINSFELAKAAGLVAARNDDALMWPGAYSLLWYLVEKNLRIKWRQTMAHDDARKMEPDLDALVAPFRADYRVLIEKSRSVAEVTCIVTFSNRIRWHQSELERRLSAETNLMDMPYFSIESIARTFEAYNDTIRDLAAQTGAVLVDDPHRIPGDAEHYADSVHFTASGSRVMAMRVVDGLLSSGQFQALVEKARLQALGPDGESAQTTAE